MAGRRKAEIQLQMQIESQEEWEELMSKEGLNVIDVYQEWCGPCTGMLSNFKKMKNEVGDPLLKFITAKADTIDSLEKYRGHCEPCFLFYAGGCLVGVVRGANAPKILRTITEQLKQEHKVMDGNSERKEIKDPFIAEMEAKEKEADKQDDEEEEEGVKEVTIALIKPDAVEAGKVDQILEDIKAHGIEVLRHEERKMTEDEVREFYSHLQDSDFFEDLVKFMTSGPSHILALTKGKTGENIIDEFRDLIGPTDVEEAKTQKPESLRAKHGQQTFMNALHGSSSAEMATRELAFFFPDFAAPPVEGKPKLQRTLALVRPEAFKQHKDAILEKIRESGFKVAMQKEMQLTREMAEDFYREHEGQDYFEQLVANMSSGPVYALGLAREDAIEGWRNMLGPKEVPKAKEEAPESLRAQFAVDDAINSLHGSDSEDTAKKELKFFFPMEQTVAVIKPDAEGTKDEIIERIHEAGFRIAARKETTLSRDVAEEFYADHKDKDYYNELVDHMTSGPTYLMVLSREAAVDGWREMIGPTDPTQAKDVAPDSLRATYGENILKNAVHGSSNPEHAKKTIQAIFGDLKFSEDGILLDTIDEEPEKEEGEKPQSDSTKEAEEASPEFKQQEEEQKEEEKSTEEPKEEEKQEEQQQQEPSDEQSSTEQQQQEPSDEQSPTEQQQQEPSDEQSPTEQQQQEPSDEKSPTEQQQQEPSDEKSPTEQQQQEPSDEQSPTEETKTEQQTEEEAKTEETKTEQQSEEEPKTDTKTDTKSKGESQEDTKTDTKSEGESQQDTKKDENTDTETQQDKKADTTSETYTKKASTEESKQETTEEQQKEDTKHEVNTQQEQKEEEPKEPEKTEEKAPSPKPSETETKPSETEAQQSETEAKPSETEAQPSETEAKPEEQKEGESETEQKTEGTAEGDEEKKEESQTEEKTPEAENTTEESKDEKKEEETKQEGAD